MMKLKTKVKIILSSLIIMSVMVTGCQKELTIEQRYEEVNKSKLSYEITPNMNTYETENSFVGTTLLGEIPRYDDKTYGHVLEDFTYYSEENPTNVSYEKALELASSVLPDDIKEERVKYDEEVGKSYIVYSSSQGNFVLGLVHGFNEDNITYNKDRVVGIDYQKEIVE
jgi:hypothetical protein